MSDALFLPRELFAPVAPQPSVAPPALTPSRRAVNFESGEAVAADLLKALAPATLSTPKPAVSERRRKPRPASARGVDLFIF